jgi:hypothetical protein
MRRTKYPNQEKNNPQTNTRDTRERNEEALAVYSELVNRSKLASALGQHYGGNRDIYEALGYKKTLYPSDYITQYSRQDIAAAVVDRPVDKTWEGDFSVSEVDVENSTFEDQFEELKKRLKLTSKFKRLDRLSSLGEFGILLLGFDGVKTNEDFSEPVQPGNRKLLYVKPLSQESVEIDEYVDDPADPRFGLPLLYRIQLTEPGAESHKTLRVHYTRVIHVVEKLMESEVKGVPVLQNVYNRLQDLERLVGGSAEMFWRGARPGYQGKVDKDYEMGDDAEKQMKTQLDEFENHLRRFFLNQGVELETLSPQVADPKNHVDVQISMIAAAKQIPKRILMGSESAELASSQDADNWTEVIQSRRTEYAEDQIIQPFVDRLIEYGVLTRTSSNSGIVVNWPDPYAKGEGERANVGKTRADALKSYIEAPAASAVIPPKAFLKYMLGLDDDQVEDVNQMSNSDIDEEQENFEQAGGEEGIEE